jgi:CheY-like chemotaxis protein
MMPVMDGVEFRGVQRRDPEIAGLPVLVLSAHHDAEAISKRLGAEGLVRKPVDVERLLSMVEAHCIH